MKLTKEYLATLHPEQRKKECLKEYIKCRFDIKYFIETYITVLFGADRQPFKLYPHQIDSLDSYERYTNNILMKSRQQGLTTFSAAYIVSKINFNNNFKVVIISKTLKDSKDFLKMIKEMLNDAREKYPWLIADYRTRGGDLAESITLTTGSLVKAEAATEDAGRGTPGLTMVVVDECAFIDRKSPEKMGEIWSAVGPALAAVKGKAIIISTPKGSSGWYFETYQKAKDKGFHIINAHWSIHPIYNQGMYQWIEDLSYKEGGYLKFYNEEWPESIFDKEAQTYIKVDKLTYPFNTDGKIRSPWYDLESIKLGPRLTSCELDCVFVGTGGEVFSGDILRELKLYSETITFTNPYEINKGIYKEYREYRGFIEGHRYLLSADVATGDGSDYSAFTVLDITTLEVCATYKAQLLPTAFATIIFEICGKRFGYCTVIVENAGGGETTLQELKRLGYKSIYYSTLQKKDPSTGVKKKKIGLWPSADVRFQGGDRLEEVIRLRRLKIPCAYLIEEFYTWIWDKDGKRRHAPQKNDDIIMALQHGIWYLFYVYDRGQRNKTNFESIFEAQRNGKSIKLSDTSKHASNQTVVNRTDYMLPASNRTYVSGSVDNMVDARILTQRELQDKIDVGKKGQRRIFI